MQEYLGKNKFMLFCISIVITVIFIFVSIPQFVSKDELSSLKERMQQYQMNSSFQPKPNGSTSNFGTGSNNSFSIPDVTDSNEFQDDDREEIINKKPTDSNETSEEEINTGTSSLTPVLKEHTIFFDSNGANHDASFSLSCSSSSESCTIKLPSISSSREVLGWSRDKNSTSPTYFVGQTISVFEDLNFYAISKQNYTVTIYGNGAFPNIQKVACSLYNQNTTCSVLLPEIPKDYYTDIGYDISSSSNSIVYKSSETLNLNQDIVLYAVRKVDTNSYDKYRNVSKNVFEKINVLRNQNGLSSLSWNQSLENSAMLRVSEVMQNYDYNVNGDYHYRISNGQPFYTVNHLAYGENFDSIKELNATTFHNRFVNSKVHYENMMNRDYNTIGIAVGYDGKQYYIVELFGL